MTSNITPSRAQEILSSTNKQISTMTNKSNSGQKLTEQDLIILKSNLMEANQALAVLKSNKMSQNVKVSNSEQLLTNITAIMKNSKAELEKAGIYQTVITFQGQLQGFLAAQSAKRPSKEEANKHKVKKSEMDQLS